MGRLRIDRVTGPPAVLATGGGRILCRRCYRARSGLARLVGLLATPDLAAEEAVWLERCASVHAVGLRTPIGCAFLDEEGRVIRVVDPLRPWRIAWAHGACHVVECRAGVLGDIATDEVLHLC